jgi:MarR family transcriptional regulator, transcriptional regulator for hemolysin
MATRTDRASVARESPRCLAGNLNWLLSQAHFALGSELTAAFAPLGVSSRGYHVLAAALTGDHTQTELAEMVGLDKTTMVVTIDELEAAGLAERRPSSKDRRARVIGVTKAGRRKIAEGEKLVEQVQSDVLATLPARERRLFLDVLARLVEERLSETVECSPPLRRREPRA